MSARLPDECIPRIVRLWQCIPNAGKNPTDDISVHTGGYAHAQCGHCVRTQVWCHAHAQVGRRVHVSNVGATRCTRQGWPMTSSTMCFVRSILCVEFIVAIPKLINQTVQLLSQIYKNTSKKKRGSNGEEVTATDIKRIIPKNRKSQGERSRDPRSKRSKDTEKKKSKRHFRLLLLR